ncbi:MIT domain-containing protein 1 [Balamuthia mandrillaris]
MADCSGLLQTGLSFVQKATEQDNAGNYSEAFRLYSLAIEAFLSVIKMERNKRIKQTVARKASEYMARAEQLKEILSAPIEGMQFPSVPSSSLSGLDQVSLNSAAVKETQQQPPGIHFPSPPSVNGYPSSPSSSSAPSSSFPSSPSFAPSSSSSAPSPSFGAEHNRSDDITITLEEGQTGHTFESLFGSYLAGSTEIRIEDPNIRFTHQLYNFLRFCELVVSQRTCRKLTLVTYFESEAQKSEMEANLREIGASLMVRLRALRSREKKNNTKKKAVGRELGKRARLEGY